MDKDILFEVSTPLSFIIRIKQNYWELIIKIKYPVMAGRENEVKKTLTVPDEIRLSRSDSSVYLFYRVDKPGHWICAVAKRSNKEGFLITSYPTDKIKEGETIWSK